MPQKYWYTRSFSNTKQTNKDSFSTDSRTRPQGLKTVFYNQNSRKQVSELSASIKKLNSYFSHLKFQNQANNQLSFSYDDYSNEIRCLKHNSNIIIFCFADNKLLCSSCVYGSSQHSKHRVHQARSVSGHIQHVLMGHQKLLKIKSGELNSKRIVFDELASKIQNLKQQKLQQLSFQLQSINASLANMYQKHKKKINETFDHTKQQVENFVEQMLELGKNMKCEHPLIPVRHIYIQEVIQQMEQIGRLVPGNKLSQNVMNTLLVFGKGIINSFKYGLSAINK